MLKLFKRKQETEPESTGMWRWFTENGVALGNSEGNAPQDVVDAKRLDNAALDGFLAQMDDEGRLAVQANARLLPWGDVFDLLESADYQGCGELLALPEAVAQVPSLISIGSLTDRAFAIAIQCWRDPQSGSAPDVEICGAIVKEDTHLGLMPRKTWELLGLVLRFQERPDQERDAANHRRHWGRIRRAAIAAGTELDKFLLNTVVLTPEKLEIALRKYETAGTRVVEIVPSFEGAPDKWMEAFDSHRSVLDLYNITTPNGIVQVEIAPNVKTVLDSIKRLPGRRVAGARAEAFLVNPFAALGESAIETIDEEQFMEARAAAGLLFERFFAQIERDAIGYPVSVALRIESAKSSGAFDIDVRPFADDAELEQFVAAVEHSLANGLQLCAWEGYDFELMGETEGEVALLKQALVERRKPRVLVSYASIFDLSAYAERIEGIGEEKPFYSPIPSIRSAYALRSKIEA